MEKSKEISQKSKTKFIFSKLTSGFIPKKTKTLKVYMGPNVHNNITFNIKDMLLPFIC